MPLAATAPSGSRPEMERLMLSFTFQTTIADLDATVVGEPHHPSLVLVLEVDDGFVRLIVPNSSLTGGRTLLAIGATVRVSGEVRDTPYGATHVADSVFMERQVQRQ